jgi:cyclohexa-1,5-dienecarbonyl-CoA hydratase
MITLTSTPTTWRITLDAPPLNILDIRMLAELREALTKVEPDRHLLVIEASGGRAFSAGVSVPDHLGDRAATMLELFHDSIRLLSNLDVVTVALVRGVALGGGAELAQACDFILASDDARFGQPEIALGVFAPVASWQLSRQIAPRKGLELLLTGDPIDAQTAERLGLVNVVFPAATFEQSSNAWLERLTRHSASSLRLAKKAFRRAASQDLDERLGDVERLYLGELMATEDATEGMKAFMEKREPRWRHR